MLPTASPASGDATPSSAPPDVVCLRRADRRVGGGTGLGLGRGVGADFAFTTGAGGPPNSLCCVSISSPSSFSRAWLRAIFSFLFRWYSSVGVGRGGGAGGTGDAGATGGGGEAGGMGDASATGGDGSLVELATAALEGFGPPVFLGFGCSRDVFFLFLDEAASNVSSSESDSSLSSESEPIPSSMASFSIL